MYILPSMHLLRQPTRCVKEYNAASCGNFLEPSQPVLLQRTKQHLICTLQFCIVVERTGKNFEISQSERTIPTVHFAALDHENSPFGDFDNRGKGDLEALNL